MHRAGQSWVLDCDVMELRAIGASAEHARFVMHMAIHLHVDAVRWLPAEERLAALFPG